jgi:hypothetical protein
MCFFAKNRTKIKFTENDEQLQYYTLLHATTQSVNRGIFAILYIAKIPRLTDWVVFVEVIYENYDLTQTDC